MANYMGELLDRSKKAQEVAANYSQEKVEKIIAGIGYACAEENFEEKFLKC